MRVLQNLTQIRENIADAEARSGRARNSVRLIAVSKTVALPGLYQAYEAGQKDFGENRIQEWRDKALALPDDCRWHIIGRLQTNKVKYLDNRVAFIHSLDRFPLLEELNKEGAKRQIVWQALLQVNVAEDEAKAGLDVVEVRDFLQASTDYAHVAIRGLMTIGAWQATADETRSFFRELRLLRDRLREEGIPRAEGLNELSMGMSHDYELAIEEGATMVRVGSLVFGARI